MIFVVLRFSFFCSAACDCHVHCLLHSFGAAFWDPSPESLNATGSHHSKAKRTEQQRIQFECAVTSWLWLCSQQLVHTPSQQKISQRRRLFERCIFLCRFAGVLPCAMSFLGPVANGLGSHSLQDICIPAEEISEGVFLLLSLC